MMGPGWRWFDRFVLALIIGCVVALVWHLSLARAHYQPGRHNVQHAINLYWCGKSNLSCWRGAQAWKVAGCETGYTYSVWARNGQYLGLFQMGRYERATYGHGWNPWAQARAAHRYFMQSGWRPWECASILGIR